MHQHNGVHQRHSSIPGPNLNSISTVSAKENLKLPLKVPTGSPSCGSKKYNVFVCCFCVMAAAPVVTRQYCAP